MRPLLALLVVALSFGCASKPTPATEKELEPEDQTGKPAPIIRDENGFVATIVYVAELSKGAPGTRGGPTRPGAVIFSSDPDSPYINDRPRPSRVLKPVPKGRMKQLFDQLRDAGFERLPGEAQLPDEPITGERQIVVIRDGKRFTYRQSVMKQSAEAFKVFAASEKVLVNASHEQDPVVQTIGRESTHHLTPLNPDADPGIKPDNKPDNKPDR